MRQEYYTVCYHSVHVQYVPPIMQPFKFMNG